MSRTVTQILEAEYRQLQKEVDELVAKNQELLGPDTAQGFIFLGRWFPGTGIIGRANQDLHPDLHLTMHRLVRHLKEVEDDRQIISQVLGKLISSCDAVEDMRNELPECVVALDPQYWGSYRRTRDPAESIKGNPMYLRQYRKVLTRIESYCAMRLLI